MAKTAVLHVQLLRSTTTTDDTDTVTNTDPNTNTNTNTAVCPNTLVPQNHPDRDTCVFLALFGSHGPYATVARLRLRLF